jgi:hypothetical protein
MDDKKEFEELTDLDLMKCFAWQSKAIDCSMIHYTCKESRVNHYPIGIKRFKRFEERANSGVKHLFVGLPFELHFKIFLQLDLQTLGNIRLIHPRLRDVVDGIDEYRRVRTYAYDAVRAMRDTRTITFHSLTKVYQVLTGGTCVNCTNFGPFVSLLSFQRCCFLCLRIGHPGLGLHMFDTEEAAYPAPIRQQMDNLRANHSIVLPDICFKCNTHTPRPPGCGPWDYKRKFISYEAYDDLIRPYGGSTSVSWGLAGAVRMAVLDNDHHRVEHGILCGGCKPKHDNHNYVYGYRRTSPLSKRARTIEAFLEHVKTCSGARQQWDELSPEILNRPLGKKHRLRDWSFLPGTEPEQHDLREYSGWSDTRPLGLYY